MHRIDHKNVSGRQNPIQGQRQPASNHNGGPTSNLRPWGTSVNFSGMQKSRSSSQTRWPVTLLGTEKAGFRCWITLGLSIWYLYLTLDRSAHWEPGIGLIRQGPRSSSSALTPAPPPPVSPTRSCAIFLRMPPSSWLVRPICFPRPVPSRINSPYERPSFLPAPLSLARGTFDRLWPRISPFGSWSFAGI